MQYLVNIIHILFSGPLLMYVGYFKPVTNNIGFSKYLYHILLALGVLLLILFSYKIINKIISHSVNQYITWYIIHALIFAPLLIWCGIRREKTPQIIFSLLLAIGCAAFGYHLIKLISKMIL